MSHPHYGGGVTPRAGGKASPNIQGVERERIYAECTRKEVETSSMVISPEGGVNLHYGSPRPRQVGLGVAHSRHPSKEVGISKAGCSLLLPTSGSKGIAQVDHAH